MKPKNASSKVGTPVREHIKAIGPEEKPKAQPVKVQTVYRVKCVWNGTVKVLAEKTPSGTAYTFHAQETQEVNKKDVKYLVGLGQNQPGCCSGSGTPRRYFELV